MGMAIGLTGGISSGKSLAGNYLSRWFEVVDSDQIVHDLYRTDAPLIQAIQNAFGSEYADSEGVKRKSLRQIVFSEPSKLETLNRIVRPRTTEVLEQKIANSRKNPGAVIFLIPLLFENHWETRLDHVLLLGCSESTQIRRVMERDQCSLQEAQSIVSSQMPLFEKQKLCHYYIENEGEPEELYQHLDHWRSLILAKA